MQDFAPREGNVYDCFSGNFDPRLLAVGQRFHHSYKQGRTILSIKTEMEMFADKNGQWRIGERKAWGGMKGKNPSKRRFDL